MTRAQAELLTGALAAAWPWAQWPEPTMLLYRTHLEQLADVELARDVVDGAITSMERPPTIAALLDSYHELRRRKADAAALRALPPPPLTAEERAENAKRLRDLLAQAEAAVDANRRRAS